MRQRTAYLMASLILFVFTTTSAQVEQYINTYATLAQSESQRSNIPASIILGQGILESSKGMAPLALNSNNHFGIKCKSDWTGQKYFHFDDDEDENGRLVKSCFRVYGTVEESYIDHTNFLLERPHYQELFSYGVKDYLNWAKGLKRCGYATDKKYAEKLIRIIETNQLYRFDGSDFMVMEAPSFYIPHEFLKTEELSDPVVFTEDETVAQHQGYTEPSITATTNFNYEVAIDEMAPATEETPIREPEQTLYDQIVEIRNKPLLDDIELEYTFTNVIPNTSSEDKNIQNLSRKPRFSGAAGPR